MVSGQLLDHEPQADVVFVIEATSMNGTYINEIKSNYVIPILEYFNQGPIEKLENSCENRNCLYTIILYHGTDIRPKPCCQTFPQERDPHFILSIIDKVKLSGGKAQSHANIAEGLATCLQFFDDIETIRNGCQKFCILICSSPPFSLPVMENAEYAGKNLDELATFFLEKKILVSILSPRKIPAFVKLYEKVGGDLSHASSKNYSKNKRHLVLLNGFSLKERAVSPSNVNPHALPVSSPKSNHGNIGSPTPIIPFRTSTTQPGQGQVQHQVPAVDINQQQMQSQQQQSQQSQSQPQPPPPQQQQQQQQQHQQPSQPSQPQSQPPQPQQSLSQPSPVPQQQVPQPQQQLPQITQQQLQHPQTPQMITQQSLNANPRSMTGLTPTFSQPSINFQRGTPQQPGRWPVTAPQQRPFIASSNPSQSALIAQLTQPPSSMPPQFSQRFDGSTLNQQTVNIINQVPNQQLHPQFQHQLQQQQQQQMQQSQPIRMVSPNNLISTQMQQTQINPQQMNPIQNPSERQNIWQGILEWNDKTKNPGDVTRQVPCAVSANMKEGEPELKADNWPPKLIMQLLPKPLISNIGGVYLKNSTSVLFHPQPCEALDSLTKVMSNGFAGCVQFGNVANQSSEIKVLILLYTNEKRAYLGFIPNDQTAFVDRLRKLIQQKKNCTIPRPIQGNQNQNTTGSQTGTPTGPIQTQQGHIGNTMIGSNPLANPLNTQQTHLGGLMVGGIPHGGVSNTNPMLQATNSQQSIMHQAPNPMNVSQGPPMGIRGNSTMLGSQTPMNDTLQTRVNRQQNLLKIQTLKQNLEAAEQQELLFQKQIEQQPQYGRHQMVNIQQSPQQTRSHPTGQTAPPTTSQFDDVSSFDFLS